METPTGDAPKTNTKEYWEVVHCTVCTTDFLKGELPPPTGSGPQCCPQCNGQTLKPGKHFKSPTKLRAPSEAPRDREDRERQRSPDPKRTPPRKGERPRSATAFKEEEPASIIKRA